MEQGEMTALEGELLALIIETCERDPGMAVEMTSDSPLIGPDSMLGLDSLDAVEIVSLIHTRFGVRITSKETSIEVLNSLRTMADYIELHRR